MGLPRGEAERTVQDAAREMALSPSLQSSMQALSMGSSTGSGKGKREGEAPAAGSGRSLDTMLSSMHGLVEECMERVKERHDYSATLQRWAILQ